MFIIPLSLITRVQFDIYGAVKFIQESSLMKSDLSKIIFCQYSGGVNYQASRSKA